MSNKIIDFPTENSVIHIRGRTGGLIVLSAFIYGIMTTAVLFSHVGTQNHTVESETRLTGRMDASEARITKRIEDEAGEMNRMYLMVTTEVSSERRLTNAYVNNLVSVMRNAKIEVPSDPRDSE